jgi:hypothetical protein
VRQKDDDDDPRVMTKPTVMGFQCKKAKEEDKENSTVYKQRETTRSKPSLPPSPLLSLNRKIVLWFFLLC